MNLKRYHYPYHYVKLEYIRSVASSNYLKNNASKMAQGLSLSEVLEQIIDSEDEVSDFSDIFDEGK